MINTRMLLEPLLHNRLISKFLNSIYLLWLETMQAQPLDKMTNKIQSPFQL